VEQVAYYFSAANLVSDSYLRQQMVGEGWLSIELLASFKRLRAIAGSDLALIHQVPYPHLYRIAPGVVQESVCHRGLWIWHSFTRCHIPIYIG